MAQYSAPLVLAALTLALGFISGRFLERRHYQSILAREGAPGQAIVLTGRTPPMYTHPPKTQLVSGSVVISADYYKRFVAGLRTLIGGRLSSYESLLDRARREAILRMREQAQNLGATHIMNVKLETMAIGGRHPGSVACLEVLAYGTALIP